MSFGVFVCFIYHIKNCHYHFTVNKLTFIVIQYYDVTLLNFSQMCLAFHWCNYSYLHLSHNIGMSTKFIQYISDVQYLLNLCWTMKWSLTEITNLPTRGSSTALWLQTWSKQEKQRQKTNCWLIKYQNFHQYSKTSTARCPVFHII